MERIHPEPLVTLSEYKHARAKMPEHTHETLDRLRGEILMICKAHEVDHPLKLGREGKEPTTETLKRVHDLMQDMLFIFEHKELPPGTEKNMIDDREYVVPLEAAEGRSGVGYNVYDQQGRFFILDHASIPSILYDHEGNKTILPHDKDSFYFDFCLLGSQLVLLRYNRQNTESQHSLVTIRGEILPIPCREWKGVDEHIVAIAQEAPDDDFPRRSNSVYSPVNEQGTILEHIHISGLKETAIIGGKRYFVTKNQENDYEIHVLNNDHLDPVGSYSSRPILCEKNGRLEIVVRDEVGAWMICDEGGNYLRSISIPNTYTIFKAAATHERYFFDVMSGNEQMLLDETGAMLWKSPFSDAEEIQVFFVDQGHFWFSTSNTEGGGDMAFYDQEGKEIIQYWSSSTHRAPIFVGEDFAYVFYPTGSTAHENPTASIGHHAFPGVTFGTFASVHSIQAIDDHRFYVIGIEKNDDGSHQMAKRVYDLRDYAS